MFKDKEITSLKLSDFGLSKINHFEKFYTQVGTFLYIAPEILANNSYNEKCDIWSLGILLYVLISGSLPVSKTIKNSENHELLLKYYEENDIDYNGEVWNKISVECFDLIKSLLKHDPNERPSAAEILNHQWFDLMLDDSYIIDKNLTSSLKDSYKTLSKK